MDDDKVSRFSPVLTDGWMNRVGARTISAAPAT